MGGLFHTPVHRVIVVPAVPDPVVRAIDTETVPTFDIVRIERGGQIVVAGRWVPHQNISILINGKIVATERTDSRGEFVYAPTHPLARVTIRFPCWV